MVLEGARVGLGFGVTGGISTHCGGKIGVREDLGDIRVEPGHSDGPGRDLADALCVVVLVHDPGGVGLAGLHHRVLGDIAVGVGGASERVVGDDTLDNRVEGGHIWDRCGQFPDRGLGVCGLDKVSHVLFLSCLFSGGAITAWKRGILAFSAGYRSGVAAWLVWGTGREKWEE